MRTAGRTVLFSSLTVAAALASLLVFPQRFLYSMGLGGLARRAVRGGGRAACPAGGAEHARDRGSTRSRRASCSGAPSATRRPTEPGFWYRLSRFVMRRPIPIATLSAAFLIVLGLPFLSIKFTTVDAQVLPESASARQVDDVMRADFPPFRDTPIRLAIEGGGRGEASAIVVSEVERDPGSRRGRAARSGSAAA